MLTIKIQDKEAWNYKTEEFKTIKGCVLNLEHSLVSLSKWESIYKKPFLSSNPNERTREEILDYIKCMTITQNVNEEIYELLSNDELKIINDYITDSRTATWFNDKRNQEGTSNKKQNQEKITSELIYYWMISLQIPFECQRWHLNRLLTLIRVCNVKEKQSMGKNGKMSKRDILSQNKALNSARRKRLGTKG